MPNAIQSSIFADFGEMMRHVVLPMHLANPTHSRLDSPRTDGNWDVLCRFRWKSAIWRVHSDSRYEPLLLAYYGWQFGPGEDTFTTAEMEAGVRLDIVPHLAVVRETEHRYLYLYRDDAASSLVPPAI